MNFKFLVVFDVQFNLVIILCQVSKEKGKNINYCVCGNYKKYSVTVCKLLFMNPYIKFGKLTGRADRLLKLQNAMICYELFHISDK